MYSQIALAALSHSMNAADRYVAIGLQLRPLKKGRAAHRPAHINISQAQLVRLICALIKSQSEGRAMNTNPENTNEQLNRLRYQRAALQGVLNYRMSPSPDKCIVPFAYPRDRNGVQHCTQLLLKYASEENRLRQRVRRKAQISSVETAPVSSWQLRAEVANGESAVFEVIETYSTTGRADECELVLPLPHISRKHAVLMPRAGGLGVRDLNSSNGTYVNGVLMQYAIMHEGDILTIGWQDFVVKYCGPAEGILIA